MQDMIRHLPASQGYSESAGIYSARTAVAQYYQDRGMRDAVPEDIYLGNGVAELITITLQALINPWTRSSSLLRTTRCGPA